MSDNHCPASEGLSALTHTELLEFEQMLHEEFEATYHEAQEAIAATGKVSAALAERLVQIQGQPPSLLNPPRGCRFHPRCPIAEPRCAIETPPLKPRPAGGVECLLVP